MLRVFKNIENIFNSSLILKLFMSTRNVLFHIYEIFFSREKRVICMVLGYFIVNLTVLNLILLWHVF